MHLAECLVHCKGTNSLIICWWKHSLTWFVGNWPPIYLSRLLWKFVCCVQWLGSRKRPFLNIPRIEQWFSKFSWLASEYPPRLVKTRAAVLHPQSPSPDQASGEGKSIHISNKFPGAAGIAHLGTILQGHGSRISALQRKYHGSHVGHFKLSKSH